MRFLNQLQQELTPNSHVDIQIEEDPRLPLSGLTSSESRGLHPILGHKSESPQLQPISGFDINELVHTFRENLRAHELQKTLLTMNDSKFKQLTSTSFEIIIPLLTEWLFEGRDKLNMALLILVEATKRFKPVFREARNQVEIKRCLQSLQSILRVSNLVADLTVVSPEEIMQLYQFLDDCTTLQF